MSFKPSTNMVGSFTQNDGTIDFYLRINALIDSTKTVLDLGAGRAAWYDDDCLTRKNIRLLKGKVKSVIAADIDDAVLNNKASNIQIVMKHGKLDLEPESIDLIVSDYVIEHVENPLDFFTEIDKYLKKGGWFCARTPHKFSYVALISSIVSNSLHHKILRFTQPERKAMDIFPTHYKVNSLVQIKNFVPNWENFSFIYRTEPAYYFGNRIVFHFLSFLHRIMPAFFCGNLFVFVKKT